MVMNRNFIRGTFAMLVPFMAQALHAQSDDNGRLNVLMIAVDDLKPVLGCYGDEYAISPNIDKLASTGAVYNSCYCQQAISSATRASLLTGVRPDSTKVWDLKTKIRDVNPGILTLPEYFCNSGYETVGIGKIFDGRTVDTAQDSLSWSYYIDFKKYIDPKYRWSSFFNYQNPETAAIAKKYIKEAEDAGITGYARIMYALKYIKPSTEAMDLPDNAYPDGAIADGAVDFLTKRKGSEPFFLAVGFQKPHLPFTAPLKYWNKYKRSNVPLAKYQKKALGSPDFANHRSGELKSYTDIPPVYTFSDINNVVLSESKQRELIHGYYACVTYIDAQIGKILSALERLGLADNTVVVLWGDHGWHLGDHGLWNKHTNFENATRVPLIVHIPGEASAVISNPVEMLDIFPTICDATGMKIPEGLEGESLCLSGSEDVPLEDDGYAVSQWPGGQNTMGYSIRTSRYRYTVWLDWKDRVLDTENIRAEELYDYESDPYEKVNLVNSRKYRKDLEQMREIWNEYKIKNIK